ncbi:MAG: enolase C-terminal domain-like protein [Acidimicrobiales bacterium]
MADLCRQAVADGFRLIKLKVGTDRAADHRRLSLAREVVGPEIGIAVDANQRWGVDEAVEWINDLARYDLRWIEEPTHPDDVVGHAEIARRVAPVPVATGEHLANAVLAKQLLGLEGTSVLQLDATRVGGLNEQIAMALLAAEAGIDMIPHAGGIGLCEAVQHLTFFNAIALAPRTETLALEHVDHLHEFMATPVEVVDARYRVPTVPGNGMAFLDETFTSHRYPDGTAWAPR